VGGSAGYAWLGGWPTFLNYLKATPYHLFSNYTLSVIPLFILMGALAEKSGPFDGPCFAPPPAGRPSARRAGDGGDRRLHRLRRDLRLLGRDHGDLRRAALPELRSATATRRLCDRHVIAVGGTLGILIPPSVILVVYAISTEQNIAKLFMAALVIPG
jgi:C4-dicarboxylate transporter DctM subunit